MNDTLAALLVGLLIVDVALQVVRLWLDHRSEVDE